MMTTEKKKEIIAAYGRTPDDTGSPEVQVALLTERINTLTCLLYTSISCFRCPRWDLRWNLRITPMKYASIISILNLMMEFRQPIIL